MKESSHIIQRRGFGAPLWIQRERITVGGRLPSHLLPAACCLLPLPLTSSTAAGVMLAYLSVPIMAPKSCTVARPCASSLRLLCNSVALHTCVVQRVREESCGCALARKGRIRRPHSVSQVCAHVQTHAHVCATSRR